MNKVKLNKQELLKDLKGVYSIIKYDGNGRSVIDYSKEKEAGVDAFNRWSAMIYECVKDNGKYALCDFQNLVFNCIDYIEELSSGKALFDVDIEQYIEEQLCDYDYNSCLTYWPEINSWLNDCHDSIYYVDEALAQGINTDFFTVVNYAYYLMINEIFEAFINYVTNNYKKALTKTSK